MKYCIPSLAIVVLLLLPPVAAQAVQFGWQPLPDGGLEYLVQVEPELLDSFHQEGFTSDVPANLQRNLRRIRITIGTAKLPNQGDVIGPKEISKATEPTPAAPRDLISDSVNSKVIEQPQATATAPPLLPTPAASPPPSEPSASTFSRLDLPPPPEMNETQSKVESSPADVPRPLSSLPFFQSGQITKLNGSNPSRETQTTTPRLTENEGPAGDSRNFSSDHLAMAAKPAVLETPVGQDKPSANTTVSPTPWFPLMGALLALFASLGVNVYLAWIHQSVRMKYSALVRRMQGSPLAAT
jgi:hypothetical protein